MCASGESLQNSQMPAIRAALQDAAVNLTRSLRLADIDVHVEEEETPAAAAEEHPTPLSNAVQQATHNIMPNAQPSKKIDIINPSTSTNDNLQNEGRIVFFSFLNAAENSSKFRC